MRSRHRIATALAGVMLLAACDSEVPGVADPAVDTRADLLEMRPDSAAPGEIIELRFPEESLRGIGYALEEATDDGWRVRFLLSSVEREDGEPQWWPAEDPDAGWEDVEVSGPGPEYVRIPEVAGEGTYRLCSADARRSSCASLEVSR